MPANILQFSSKQFTPAYCRTNVLAINASLAGLRDLITTASPTTSSGMTAVACWKSKLRTNSRHLETLVKELGPDSVEWSDDEQKEDLMLTLKGAVEIYSEIVSQMLENFSTLDHNNLHLPYPSARGVIAKFRQSKISKSSGSKKLFTETELNNMRMLVQLRNHSCHSPTGYLQSRCGNSLCNRCEDLEVLIESMHTEATKDPTSSEFLELDYLLHNNKIWRHARVYQAVWDSPSLYPTLIGQGVMNITTGALRKAFMSFGFPELLPKLYKPSSKYANSSTSKV